MVLGREEPATMGGVANQIVFPTRSKRNLSCQVWGGRTLLLLRWAIGKLVPQFHVEFSTDSTLKADRGFMLDSPPSTLALSLYVCFPMCFCFFFRALGSPYSRPGPWYLFIGQPSQLFLMFTMDHSMFIVLTKMIIALLVVKRNSCEAGELKFCHENPWYLWCNMFNLCVRFGSRYFLRRSKKIPQSSYPSHTSELKARVDT